MHNVRSYIGCYNLEYFSYCGQQFNNLDLLRRILQNRLHFHNVKNITIDEIFLPLIKKLLFELLHITKIDLRIVNCAFLKITDPTSTAQDQLHKFMQSGTANDLNF